MVKLGPSECSSSVMRGAYSCEFAFGSVGGGSLCRTAISWAVAVPEGKASFSLIICSGWFSKCGIEQGTYDLFSDRWRHEDPIYNSVSTGKKKKKKRRGAQTRSTQQQRTTRGQRSRISELVGYHPGQCLRARGRELFQQNRRREP